MEDKENQEKNECGVKIKQKITIPFQWEETPGAPKKDWKPKIDYEPLDPVPPLPVKYVASVPFKWEEKPGTPLRCFARGLTKRMTQETVPEDKSLPLPPAYFSKYEDESDEGDSLYGDDYDDQDWLSELEFDAMSVRSEESFCSAPSLLANRVTPLHNPYITHPCDVYDTFEAPFSPESSKSPTNNTTGYTSLKGAEFLAQLFPLYPPKTRFLEHGTSITEIAKHTEKKQPTFLEEHKKLIGNGRRSGIIRRPCTLGELIMQSRRRSYRRKAVNMMKHNQKKVFFYGNSILVDFQSRLQ